MLISNFNAKESAKENGQGTGTTIVQISQTGKLSPFAHDRCQDAPRPMPRRRRTDDGAEHAAGRLRRRGQPADHQRQDSDRQVRLHDRARLERQAREHDLGPEHSGAVGLDRRQRRVKDDPLRQQRAQRRCREGHPHDRQLERRADSPRIRRRAAAEGHQRNGDRERHPLGRFSRSPRARPDRARTRLQRHAVCRLDRSATRSSRSPKQ